MPEDFDIPEWVSERGEPTGTMAPDALPTEATAPLTRRGVRAAREREAREREAAERRPVQRAAGGPVRGPAQRGSAPVVATDGDPGPTAASAGGSRHRPPGARHRGPSRRVRLHRTIAASTALVLVGGLAIYLHSEAPAADARVARSGGQSGPTTPSTPASSTTSSTGTAAPTPTPSPTPTATPTVVRHGTGTFTTVALPALANSAAPAGARLVRVAFQVENGIGIDPAPVAQSIASTLLDRRGWEPTDRVRFEFVTAAQLARGAVDITIRLASPDTVDRLCAPLTTNGYTSCFANHRAVLNAARWLTGVPYYKGHLGLYRIYMVNHEVGHGLGHGHEQCPGAGRPAPTMQQQTLGMQGCTINPWPSVA